MVLWDAILQKHYSCFNVKPFILYLLFGRMFWAQTTPGRLDSAAVLGVIRQTREGGVCAMGG